MDEAEEDVQLPPTVEDVARFVTVVRDPSGASEIRSFRNAAPTVKVFPPDADPRAIATYALTEAVECEGVYMTLNPLRADLKGSANAKDVLCRRRLLLDFDPKREPTKSNSTDAEKAEAWDRCMAAYEYAARRGWPRPIVGDSGNGYHLVYAIDLPHDTDAYNLISETLKAVAARFDTKLIKVDQTVKDAPRISKVLGTMTRKGPHSEERPHRHSRALDVPERLEVVTIDQLRELVREPTPKAGGFTLIVPPSDEALAASALAALSQEYVVDRGLWFKVACALHRFGDHGYRMFLDWSRGCPEKFSEAACAKLWKSLKSQRGSLITLGWLFYNARSCGWQMPTDAGQGKTGGSQGQKGQKGQGNREQQDAGACDDPYADLSIEEMGILACDQMEPESVEWLWKNRIAYHKINALVGEGDSGKSQTAIRIVAAKSTGGYLPDGSGPVAKGMCLILAAEDGYKDTVLPRLMVADADRARVKIATAKVTRRGPNGRRQIDFKSFKDLVYWDALYEKLGGFDLIVADPLPAYLGRDVNDHKNSELRAVLEPFAAWLEERRVTMLAITHLGKSVDVRTPTHKVLGSVAYVNIPRTVHMTLRDPEDKERRLFCNIKNNLAAKQPTLAYRVEACDLPHGDKIIKTSRVVFEEGTVNMDAAEILEETRTGGEGKRGPSPKKTMQAAEWLFDFLKTQPDAVPLGAIFDAAGAAGLIGQKRQSDNKWSSGALLYQAQKRVPDLEAPRDGFRVDDRQAPVKPGGKPKVHWQLVEDEASFTPSGTPF